MSQDTIPFELQIETGIAVDCNVDKERKFAGVINQIALHELYVHQVRSTDMYVDTVIEYSNVEL
jgi:hypothetical protein